MLQLFFFILEIREMEDFVLTYTGELTGSWSGFSIRRLITASLRDVCMCVANAREIILYIYIYIKIICGTLITKLECAQT